MRKSGKRPKNFINEEDVFSFSQCMSGDFIAKRPLQNTKKNQNQKLLQGTKREENQKVKKR